ncbi:hypothetical protein HMPREF0083_04116 [Aneurinibacillus aneurinilyticus ATCC 12856]|uniref:Uncharacterized protein n=1 Tax=Aneurinibacillus aneurinilyticus ATCC 12856 TaxID=649747 RepID=U1WZW4_ANEAE|nr:hypothetical protein HMPREF0083_04116 [Aneurinibacillus aneurinilyticus ATCC 12856]
MLCTCFLMRSYFVVNFLYKGRRWTICSFFALFVWDKWNAKNIDNKRGLP